MGDKPIYSRKVDALGRKVVDMYLEEKFTLLEVKQLAGYIRGSINNQEDRVFDEANSTVADPYGTAGKSGLYDPNYCPPPTDKGKKT